MNPCPRCGGPQIMLLTSWACKNECDLKVHVKTPLTNLSIETIGEHLNKLTEAVRAALIIPIKFLGPTHEHITLPPSHQHLAPKNTVTKVELFNQWLPPGKRCSEVLRDVRPISGTVHFWEIDALGSDVFACGTVFYYVQFEIYDQYRVVQNYQLQHVVCEAAA